MSGDSPDAQVREFYEQLTPSDEQVATVLAMRDLAAESRRWRRLAIGSMVAASLLAAVCGLFVAQLQQAGQEPLAEQAAPTVAPQQQAAPDLSADVMASEETAPPADEELLRVVAYRRHRDRCPACRGIGENFAALEQEFAGQPVEFVQLDFSDQSLLEETRRKSLDLGLGDVLEGGEHTGWILTNTRGDLVATLDSSSSRDALSAEITERLK